MLLLNYHRQTLAEILAAAVLQLHPDTYLLGGKITPFGFSYDFIFKYPFCEEMLVFVEERMRQLIQKGGTIKLHEMVPKNAAEFLKHHRRNDRSSLAHSSHKELVYVYQLGDFVDLVSLPCVEDLSRLGVFKLLKISQRAPYFFQKKERHVWRLTGAAFDTKEELKTFFKAKKMVKTHQELGEKSCAGFFYNSRCCSLYCWRNYRSQHQQKKGNP